MQDNQPTINDSPYREYRQVQRALDEAAAVFQQVIDQYPNLDRETVYNMLSLVNGGITPVIYKLVAG